MGKADLHIHTREGDGLDTFEQIFEHVETRTDLDVIAITEHDSLETALRARELWARGHYRFDFVAGAEMTTLEGHVVVLYIEEPLSSFQRVEATLEAAHARGGVCFAPHPTSLLTRSVGAGTLKRLQADRNGAGFDAIELANLSPPGRPFLGKARRLNESTLRLPAVGASDAHFVQAIGSAFTRFEGRSALDLRRAFASGEVSGHETCYPRLRDVGLARALAVPIAGLAATPRRLGWRRTAWSFLERHFA
jgi:predicted metal-dependent phosphoesterase TrpH